MFGARKGLFREPRASKDSTTLEVRSFFASTTRPPGDSFAPSTRVVGRFQLLRTLSAAPWLCEYVDISKTSHGRMYVVSEGGRRSLATLLSKSATVLIRANLAPPSPAGCIRSLALLRRWALGIVEALAYLHEHGVVHRNLRPKNVLVDQADRIRLSDFGLYYLTGCGQDVAFPVGCPHYLAPETIAAGPMHREPSSPKTDVWALGVLLLELYFGTHVFGPDLSNIVGIFHMIMAWSDHGPAQLAQEPDIDPLFADFLVHYWRMLGGDLDSLVIKTGIANVPATSRLPALVRSGENVEEVLAAQQDFNLYNDAPTLLPLDAVWSKLDAFEKGLIKGDTATYRDDWKHIPSFSAANMERIWESWNSTAGIKLSLAAREADLSYQYFRTRSMYRLLCKYPSSASLIRHEAVSDIPPVVRGDTDALYAAFDKDTEADTDRQVPTTKRYNELLSSPVGHAKLKRILKAWIECERGRHVYWQGLDSMCAPFLALNFDDEALAFASMRSFISSFCQGFFVHDNSKLMREFMLAFRYILSFHDPELSSHLHSIGLGPELFAISWFMTLYAHVFPLDKIFHLWDLFLVGPQFMFIFVGVSILQQHRDQLLESDFNQAMMLFSEMPAVNVEQCIIYSIQAAKITPPSILSHLQADHASSPQDHNAWDVIKRADMPEPAEGGYAEQGVPTAEPLPDEPLADEALFVSNFKLFWPEDARTFAQELVEFQELDRPGDRPPPSVIGIARTPASSKGREAADSADADDDNDDDNYVDSEIDFGASLRFVQGRYTIFYSRPSYRSLQYFSTYPLVLDLSQINGLQDQAYGDPEHDRVQRAAMALKMGVHVDAAYSAISYPPSENIEQILGKINAAKYADRVIARIARAHTTKPRHGAWGHFRRAFVQHISRPVWRAFLSFASAILFVLRVAIDMMLWLLNLNLPGTAVSLVKLSTALQQIDLRLQQLQFWPAQYAMWSLSSTKLSAKAQAQYIGFFNTVWLIANDIIIGLALGTVLVDYRYPIARIISVTLHSLTIETVDTMITWLMGCPGGLKLNVELNSFLGELFGWLVLSWSELFVAAANRLPAVIYVIGHLGVFGATMPIAVFMDLVMLSTMHLHLFYTISAKMYYWQVAVIQSLFTLFQGKKRNALRKRVDSAEYDLDQLLLGTCFFTLLVFLFPTVGVYYLLFCIYRIGVVLVHAAFEIVLAFFNHFPLFALMLRVKDPLRLPRESQSRLLRHAPNFRMA
nr:hypothetical protein HK105_008081 [Polyrhizophydium stewartii]